MDVERERRIIELCREAENVDPENLNAWLHAQVGDDSDIVAEVKEYLDLMDVDGYTDPLDDMFAASAGSATATEASTPMTRLTTEGQVAQHTYLGSRIGPYVLERELGRGGMGAVYLGRRDDDELTMSVAVKLIQARMASPDLVARFRRERQVLADLKHPHIAMLLDAGTVTEGFPYFIMEFIEGQTIDAWCKARSPSLTDLLQLFRKVLSAVGFAHASGIVHRDIKPGNLMVTQGASDTHPEPKLLDFGIAAFSHELEGQSGLSPMTPEYASPEQQAGRPVNQTADIYALGLVLLQLLCGVSPAHMGRSPQHMISRLMSEGRRREPDSEPDNENEADPSHTAETEPAHETVPEALGYVLRTATEWDPEQRYPDAEAMIRDLDRVLAILPNAAKSATATERSFDALMWYHPTERMRVRDLVDRLRETGSIEVWEESERVPADGDPLHARLAALDETHTCLVCLGSTDDQPWKHEPAIRDALAFRAQSLRIVPILLPGAPFPEKQSRLPSFLRERTWFTFPEGFHAGGIERLRATIREARLEAEAPAEPTGVCPFRGLQVFREQDAAIFFGRESITQRLLQKMAQERFCALLGPSGSGKSSIVQAGVLPVLRRRDQAILLITPTQNPLEELTFALQRLFVQAGMDIAAASLKERIEQDPAAGGFIGHELVSAGPWCGLVLVIDQFEEVFSLAKNQAKTAAFIEVLCRMVDAPEAAVKILVTMRSDFLGKCAAYPDLNTHFLESSLQVPPMKREDYARAIAAPTRLAGLRLEEGLLDRILDDVAEHPSDLPLLEHALLELYERQRDGTMTQAAYDEIGGIQGALTKRADAEYAVLDQTARATLRKMFVLCLIQPGEGTRDTRRRATREELLAVGPSSNDAEALVQRWTDARLLTAYRDTERGRDLVDVAHEALIGNWQPIAAWMTEDRETARLLDRLRQNAHLWDQGGRGEDLLLRGGPLEQMKELVDREERHLGTLEKSYVAEGVELAAREARAKEAAAARLKRRRNQAFAATVLALLLAALALNAFFQASRAKERAEAAQQVAERERLESNLSLAHMYDQKSQAALDQQNPTESWLYTLAALSMEVPAGTNLPSAVGRLSHPAMVDAARLMWTSPAHYGVRRAAFGDDGRVLALAGGDHDIHLMDLHHGGQAGVLTGHQLPIRALAFRPGKEENTPQLLASAGDDRSLLLWRPTFRSGHSQDPIHNLDHGEPVVDLAWSPDGRFLVSLAESGTLRIWRFDGDHFVPEQPRIVPPRTNGPATALAISEDGSLAAWASAAGSLQIDGIAEPDFKTITSGDHGPISDVCAMNDAWFVSHEDGSLFQWDYSGGKRERLDFHRSGQPATLAPFPDGKRLAIFDTSGGLSIWDVPHRTRLAGGEPLSITAHEMNGDIPSRLKDLDMGFQLAVHPDGTFLSVTGGDWSLWDVAQGRPAAKLAGHAGSNMSSALSKDGRLLAVGTSERQVDLWNVTNGTKLGQLSGHPSEVLNVSFSPDDRFLASGCFDGFIKFWSVDRRALLGTLSFEAGNLNHALISPDGRYLIAGGSRGILQIWSMQAIFEAFQRPGETPTKPTKVPYETLQAHQSDIMKIAFSSDGRYLASSSFHGFTTVWNLRDRTPLLEADDNLGTVYHTALSPNGALMVNAVNEKAFTIWDVAKGERIHRIPYSAQVYLSTFSPDGTMLATVGNDDVIRLWSTSNWRLEMVMAGKISAISNLLFSPDASTLIAVAESGSIQTWDLEQRPIPNALDLPFGQLTDMVFSPDAHWLATVDETQRVTIWSLKERRPHQILPGHGGKTIMQMSFSPDGSLLATASADRTIKIWDRQQGRELFSLEGHADTVEDVTFTPDGRTLASSSADGQIILWDPREGTETGRLPGHDTQIIDIGFSSDGHFLLSWTPYGEVFVWDVAKRALVASYQDVRSGVEGADLSPDDRIVAIGNSDGLVKLWDIGTQKVKTILPGQDENYAWVSFIQQGERLITHSFDGYFRLWNPATRRALAEIKRGTPTFPFFALMPGDKVLATNNPDGSVVFLDLTKLETYQKQSESRQTMNQWLHRSLFYFGYRLDGVGLVPAPHYEMEPIGDFRFAEPPPNQDLTRPKRFDLDLLRRLVPDGLQRPAERE